MRFLNPRRRPLLRRALCCEQLSGDTNSPLIVEGAATLRHFAQETTGNSCPRLRAGELSEPESGVIPLSVDMRSPAIPAPPQSLPNKPSPGGRLGGSPQSHARRPPLRRPDPHSRPRRRCRIFFYIYIRLQAPSYRPPGRAASPKQEHVITSPGFGTTTRPALEPRVRQLGCPNAYPRRGLVHHALRCL